MKKYLPMLLKGLAVFGGVVLAAVLWRSKKTSESTGQTFSSAVKNGLSQTTNFGMVVLMLLCSMALLFAGSVSAGVGTAILWGSIAASASSSFNITYVPQFISFTISAAPTSFSINVQGDGVIFNLDANGIISMSNIRLVGVVTNTYTFQLADGLVNGKNGSVTITNAAAAQLDIYAWSKDPGSFYMTYLTQRALQNSGINLRKFAYAAFPSAAATDLFTVEYNSKITQIGNRLDLQNLIGYNQNQVSARYNIDNIAPAMVDTVNFIPSADQNVYVMQYQAARGTVNSAVVAKG